MSYCRQAVNIVREGIHAYHRGLNASMLSMMMLPRLDASERLYCPGQSHIRKNELKINSLSLSIIENSRTYVILRLFLPKNPSQHAGDERSFAALRMTNGVCECPAVLPDLWESDLNGEVFQGAIEGQ